MAKGRMMVYRLYVDDLEGGTQYMTNEEFGAYMRLLNYQFRYGSIPENDFKNIVSRGLTAVEPESNHISEKNTAHADRIIKLLMKKFELRDEGYVNLRMEDTRNEAIMYSEKQSEKGKKSKPRLNHSSTVVKPIGNGNGNGKNKEGGVGETIGKISQQDAARIFAQMEIPMPGECAGGFIRQMDRDGWVSRETGKPATIDTLTSEWAEFWLKDHPRIEIYGSQNYDY